MASPTLYPFSPRPPILDLNISRSPLLSGTGSSSLLCCDISTRTWPPPSSPTSSPHLTLDKLASSHSHSAGICYPSRHRHRYLCYAPESARDKPLPALPPIPPRQIISVLELLERMDNDVVKEVQRVREGIADACLMVREYAQAERARVVQWRSRQEQDRSRTKEVDDEFWLNA